MIITKQKQAALSKLQKNELNRERNHQLASVMSLYLDQADRITQMFHNLAYKILTNKSELNNSISKFDVIISKMNDPIFVKMQNAQKSLIHLSFQHTLDFPKSAGISYKIKADVGSEVLQQLKRPIPDSKFNLSSSIWGKDKRTAIYQNLKQNIADGMTKDQLIRSLTENLKDQNTGGAFQKASRVVNTELQRSYVQGSITSSRDYNEQNPDNQLIWFRKLSPNHRIEDECDFLAGYYSLEYDVPEVPTHPWCMCLTGRMFASDYTGELMDAPVNVNGFMYIDKYKAQVPLF